MDSSQILERLKALGKVTEEDILEAEKASDDEQRNVAVVMHTMLCKSKKHLTLEEYTLGMKGCSFYAEEKVDEPWKCFCHELWLNRAKNLMELTELEDIQKLTNICITIDTLRESYYLRSFMNETADILDREEEHNG